MTDENGVAKTRYDYFPFGNELQAAGSMGRASVLCGSISCYPTGSESAFAVNQKFTGKERDYENGFDFFGARYYASSIGRFLSPDRPGYQRTEDPQSMNLYSYVRNNPLTRTDPTGNFDVSASDCEAKPAFCFDVKMAAFKLREIAFDTTNPGMFALQKVSDTVGLFGDHNGVVVTYKDLGGGTEQEHDLAETVDKKITFNSRFLGSTEEMVSTLAHEGTHVLQNERADKLERNWWDLIYSPSSLFPGKPSWEGLVRQETEAYRNQGYAEQGLHMKGQIYDPSDIKPGADKRESNQHRSEK